ncbi:MAG: hypothetical protein RL407_1244 [Bacteroidota bacterium]|jgi:hypothetical protein
MGLVTTLFLLLFKISLAFQGQLSLFSEVLQSNIQQITTAQGEGEQAVHSFSKTVDHAASILPTIELEERSEIEPDEASNYLDFQSFGVVQKNCNKGLSYIFGTKAIRGSRLPLYDFFHSWKFHLS